MKKRGFVFIVAALELPRVRYQWWSKSGGVAIEPFATGGKVRIH